MALFLRGLCLLAGYLFGGFLTAEVVARCTAGVSARDIGTGNPGMANIATHLGKKAGLLVLAGGVAVMLTGYLPVGAVLIAALAVPVGWLQYGTEAGAVLTLNAVIMVTRHWAGLQRIHRGEEPQFFRPKL